MAECLHLGEPGLDDRFAELKQQGYPAVHHSKVYADAYRPAYRVVLRELLSED